MHLHFILLRFQLLGLILPILLLGIFYLIDLYDLLAPLVRLLLIILIFQKGLQPFILKIWILDGQIGIDEQQLYMIYPELNYLVLQLEPTHEWEKILRI